MWWLAVASFRSIVWSIVWSIVKFPLVNRKGGDAPIHTNVQTKAFIYILLDNETKAVCRRRMKVHRARRVRKHSMPFISFLILLDFLSQEFKRGVARKKNYSQQFARSRQIRFLPSRHLLWHVFLKKMFCKWLLTSHTRTHDLHITGNVAQWLERRNSNPKTLGSIPRRGRVGGTFSVPPSQLLCRRVCACHPPFPSCVRRIPKFVRTLKIPYPSVVKSRWYANTKTLHTGHGVESKLNNAVLWLLIVLIGPRGSLFFFLDRFS